MNTIQKIPWPRVLGEGVIIVVSILLAFWIQAWWDARQDRGEEVVILQSVLIELQELEQDFTENEVYVDAMRASIRKLLEASVSEEVTLDEEEIDRLLSDSIYYVAPTMVDVPMMESLVSTGELSSVSNDKLRHDLRQLLFELREVRLTFEHDFDFGNSSFAPYLVRNSSMLQIWNRQAPDPGSSDANYDFEPIALDSEVLNSEILNSREFQNLLLSRDTFLYQAIDAQRGVTENLTLVIRALEDEVQR